MLSSTYARGPQVSPGRFPELEASESQPGRQLRTPALPGLPGPGPARRGRAAGGEDVGGAPIPEREASEGGGKKGGAAGEEEEGKKERLRGRGGRGRCKRAEQEGGREGVRSPARKLGEWHPSPGTGALDDAAAPRTVFRSSPSWDCRRACSTPALGPRLASLQTFRGPHKLLLASPLLQGSMVSKAAWRILGVGGAEGGSSGPWL